MCTICDEKMSASQQSTSTYCPPDFVGLPTGHATESAVARKALFATWDSGDKGLLSLTDVEQGITEFLGRRTLERSVVIRAFRAACDLVPPVADFGRDSVDSNQFRFLLIYVQHLMELCRWFCPSTPSSDGCSASTSSDPQPVSAVSSVSREVDFEAFSSSLPLLQGWEVFGSSYDDLAAAPAKAFNEADVDGNGIMSFDEFTEWVLSRGLVALHLGGGDEAVRDRHDALRLLRSKSQPVTARPAVAEKLMPTLLQAPMTTAGAQCSSKSVLKASAPATIKPGIGIRTSGTAPGSTPMGSRVAMPSTSSRPSDRSDFRGAVSTGQERTIPSKAPRVASRPGSAAGVASRPGIAGRLSKTATSCPQSLQKMQQVQQHQQQQRPLWHHSASSCSQAKAQRRPVTPTMTAAKQRCKATAAAAAEQRARVAAKAAAAGRNVTTAATAKTLSSTGRTGTMSRHGSTEALNITTSVRRLSPTTADRLSRPSSGLPSKAGSAPLSRPASPLASRPPSPQAARPTSPTPSRPASPQPAPPRWWRECASEQSTPVRTPAATPGCPGRGHDLAHCASRRFSPRPAELSRQQTTFGSASRFGDRQKQADQLKLVSRASTGQIGPPTAFKPEMRRHTLLNGPSTGSVRIPGK